MKSLLNVFEVAELMGVSPQTIWRWVALGNFPEPRRFTKRTIRWNAESIEKWNKTKPTKKEKVKALIRKKRRAKKH